MVLSVEGNAENWNGSLGHRWLFLQKLSNAPNVSGAGQESQQDRYMPNHPQLLFPRGIKYRLSIYDNSKIGADLCLGHRSGFVDLEHNIARKMVSRIDGLH